MQPFDAKSTQVGMTLVEMMIALIITSLVGLGGYQMMTKYQKYLAYKQLDQNSKKEVTDLIAVVKKDWDYRIRNEAGFLTVGFTLETLANLPCTVNCPKLKLWIRRTVNGASLIDEVTFQNICVKPTVSSVLNTVSALDFVGIMTPNCNPCPQGEVPAVKIQGLDQANNTAVLAAENRIFPNNLTKPDKINVNGTLGMQACFSADPTATPAIPLTIDVRSLFRDQSSKKLQKVQKTQIYPFENFANIKLEQ